MAKPKVFVTRVIPDEGLDKLKSHCEVEVWPDPLPPAYGILREKTKNCDGLLSMLTDRVDEPLMKASARLRVVSNYAVGFNNIDITAATRLGIAVGNTPDVLTDATADMAFCLLIAASRRLVEANRYLHEGRWKTWEPMGHIGRDLVGRTVGIIGLGRIGYAFAKRCSMGWWMRVLYSDHKRRARAEAEVGAKWVDFDTLLAQSDFISVHCSLNDSTRGMFNLEAFRKMKRSAVFINTARGPIHVHEDLTQALAEREIFAAGLDVTDPEPLPDDDPILELPNVVIAPHIASATTSTRNAMARIAAENLIAGLDGEPLRTPVNPEVVPGPRSSSARS